MFSYAIIIFMTLLPVVNPIGMAPVFLELTKKDSVKERAHIARNVAINACCLLLLTYLTGNFVLSFFSLKIPFIKISGGLLVFSTAWSMLHAVPRLTEEESKEACSIKQDISFFPMTMPITSGPGSLAIVLTLGADLHFSNVSSTLSNVIGASLGIMLLSLVIYVCYRYSGVIFNKLGVIGTNIVSKLSAFILLSISVQIVWSGLSKLVHSL